MKFAQSFVGMLSVCVFAVLISGCTGIALHEDFSNYALTTGDSSNAQLLLNLARMHQDEPPYFIQLGTISSLHTMTGSAGLMSQTAAVGKQAGLTGLNGSLSAGYTESPTFQFLPLAGPAFSQAITTPLNSKIFYTFYSNYDADELARVMVSSVRFSASDDDHSPATIYKNDPEDSSYPKFLAWCYQLRTLQKLNALIVNSRKPTDHPPVLIKNPVLADIRNAVEDSFTLDQSEAITNVTYTPAAPANGSNPSTATSKDVYVQAYYSEPYFDPNPKDAEGNNKRGPQSLKRKNLDLAMPTNSMYNSQSPASSSMHEKIEMRTFLGAMDGVAKEESYFSAGFPGMSGAKVDSGSVVQFTLGTNRDGSSVVLTALPIMELQRKTTTSSDQRIEETIRIGYEGHDYSVSDVVDVNGFLANQADLVSSNRKVFALLSDLFTATAIDPKTLTPQQYIQFQ